MDCLFHVCEVKINTQLWIMQNAQIKHIRDALTQHELQTGRNIKEKRRGGGGGEGRLGEGQSVGDVKTGENERPQ